MKLLKRIAIALLAVSALTSTFVLSGCGEGSLMDDAGDMMSEMVSDAASGISDFMSDVLPEPSSAIFEDNTSSMMESADPFSAEAAAVAGNYRKGYYAGYEDVPFVEIFEQNARAMFPLNGTAENLTVEWQEGWNGHGDHAPEEDNTHLDAGKIPFTGCIIYDDESGKECEYYLYMLYDPNEKIVSAVRVYDSSDEEAPLKDGEDAKLAVEEFLTMEQESF